jgi:hypothetical protein
LGKTRPLRQLEADFFRFVERQPDSPLQPSRVATAASEIDRL